MINLYGKGFIGSHYADMFECIVNERNDLVPKTNNLLYFISTIDNYTYKTNPYIDIETNLTTLMRVLEQCKNNGTTFNFVSSWYVYGNGHNINESHECDPHGFYSITKRTAEQLTIEYCKEFNIDYRIMRLCNVLGPNDRKASTKKNVLTFLVKKIKNNQDIELANGGEFYRTYIHVVDTCVAINLIINKTPVNEIYNIGASDYKFRDAIEYVKQKTNSTSKITDVHNKDVISFTMNCEKLNKLGFTPLYSVENCLDQLINEYN